MKCCATNCKNRGSHSFPKDPKRRELWETALRIPNFEANRKTRLCYKHFKDEDYMGHGMYIENEETSLVKKCLNRNAVPSLFDYNNYNQEPEVHLPNNEILLATDNNEQFKAEKDEEKDNIYDTFVIEMEVENNINNSIDNTFVTGIEVEKICRTCLTESAIIPLTNCNDGYTLGAMLEKIAGVSMEAGLPDVICLTCAEDLRNAMAFRCRARVSDNTLRQKTRWRLDPSLTIDSSVKVKQELDTCYDCLDQTVGLEETVVVYKQEPNTGHTDNPNKKLTAYNNNTDTLTKENKVDKPIRTSSSVKHDPVFVDINKKQIKLKPVRFQDVLKAVGPDKLPLQIKKILQNKRVKSGIKIPEKLLTPNINLKKAGGNKNKCPKPGSRIKLAAVDSMHNLASEMFEGDATQYLETKMFEGESTQNLKSEMIEDELTLKEAKAQCKNDDKNVESFESITNKLDKAHVMDKHNISLPTCPYPNCGRVYRTNNFLATHIRKCHLIIKTVRLYVCIICGKKCQSEALTLEHMKMHKKGMTAKMKSSMETMEKKYKIKTFTEKPCRETIEKKYPHKIKTVTEKPCRETIKKKHPHRIKTVTEKPTTETTGLVEKNYQCEECGRLFAYEGHLVAHVRITHNVERPYNCNICDKYFFTKSHMQNHRETHLPDRKRPFICAHCEKTFYKKHQLSVHMTSHSDLRKFMCKECGKMFGLKGNLIAHEKRVHGLYKSSVSLDTLNV